MIPAVLVVLGALGTVGGGANVLKGGKKILEASKEQKKLKLKNKMLQDKFKKQNEMTSIAMDKLANKELEVLEDFENFSNLIEKIHNRPEFSKYSKHGLTIPKFDPEELKKAYLGAKTLVGGLGGAAVGTAGYVAASGAATAAIMTFGTASTGTAISSLSGVAATNATMAALGGGSLAAGGGGMALGATLLGAASFGIAFLVGGVLFNITSSKMADTVEKMAEQIEVIEENVNKSCDWLEELQYAAMRYMNSIRKVHRIYTEFYQKLDKIISKKTDWNFFTKEEKIVTENTVLLVGLLYHMCKLELVSVAKDETKNNIINNDAIDDCIKNTELVLSEKGMG